jgi:very-short-patch-repair endonuclease
MLERICWRCGNVIPEDMYFGVGRRFCVKCEEEHYSEYQAILTQYLIFKNKVMFERSMREMEKAGVDMSKYKRYALAVEKHSASNPEQYRSSDEMIAAVIMLADGFDIEMNKRVGNYLVDMYIPELKVCLEIDGERHDHKQKEDGERDIKIRQKLGTEWEIVRIPTKYIEKNPEKLVEAVKAIYKKKKDLRENNGGILPESFSSREKALYGKAMLYRTERARKV